MEATLKKDADVSLPTGKTCGDCKHMSRCVGMFGAMATNTSCDFYPVRFDEKGAVKP